MKAFLVAATMVASATAASAGTLSLTGFLSGRTGHVTAPESWTAGGFGTFDTSGSSGTAVAQIGADWEPSPHFEVHADGLGRIEPGDTGGRRAGLVQMYATGRIYSATDQLQLRAGEFFLPTSRENTADLWTSPYMLSFSALNSWIGQEFRPLGADLEWRHFSGERTFSAAATAFRDNDTLGALLAWRGWTTGSRLTVDDETLPLPASPLLSKYFPKQRSDGTVPFERDLDGRTGFAWRMRWTNPDVLTAQFTHVDNRGDRRLYRGEYSWATSLNTAAFQFGSPQTTLLASEYCLGQTGMGAAPDFVQADFYAFYLLASHRLGRHRLSARYDVFATLDRDQSRAGSNTQHGHAVAAAWLFDLTPHLRAGAEISNVRSHSVLALESGRPESTGGRSIVAELRYSLR